jgi:serine/threonine protein kinase
MQPTSHYPTARLGQPRSNSHPTLAQLPAQVQVFLRQVIESQLYDQPALLDILQKLPNLRELNTPDKMGQALVNAGYLTEFQSQRLMSGNTQGLVLGNYRILNRLGGGTVGTVFVGEHRLLRRKVAIKVLHVDENFPPQVLERFQVEMRLLAGLQHPHIVTAYDAGVVNSSEVGMPSIHYLVMELIDGGDLEQYVYDHGVLSIEQGCEYIRQAAAGLQAAHDAHLIHRDLKPSNLLLTRDGQIKLVDFGLARQFTSNLTERSSLLGSVEFMAPEQSIDPTSVGSHSDIYGLGATLFWLISGQTPFPQSDNMVEVLRWLQTGRPRRLSDFIEDVPAELDEFVDRMLARDPEQRPQSALTVMKELARFRHPRRQLGQSDLDRGQQPPGRGHLQHQFAIAHQSAPPGLAGQPGHYPAGVGRGQRRQRAQGRLCPVREKRQPLPGDGRRHPGHRPDAR